MIIDQSKKSANKKKKFKNSQIINRAKKVCEMYFEQIEDKPNYVSDENDIKCLDFQKDTKRYESSLSKKYIISSFLSKFNI